MNREPASLSRYAQTCFFASGLGALFLSGSMNAWVQGLVIFLLGLACLLEAGAGRQADCRLSTRLLVLAGSLWGLLALSLCPWPAEWGTWLGPGQTRLLSDLEEFAPRRLHGSMAPGATWHALFKLAGASGVVYLAWVWSADRGFRRRLFVFILALGTLVAGLAIADWLIGSGRMDGPYETVSQRRSGLFRNRNHFSNYVNMCAMIGLGMFFRQCLPRRHQTGNVRWGVTGLVVAILCAASSVATRSRGGLLSLGAGAMVFALLIGFRRGFGLRGRVMVIILMLGCAFLMAYGRDALDRFMLFEKLKGVEKERLVAEGRWRIWEDSWNMSLAMKGRGIGVGAFETVFPYFQTSLPDKTVTHVENEYLQTWVEWGMIGGAIWIMIALLLLRRFWTSLRGHLRDWQIAGWSALAVTAVHAAASFPLHIPSNAWMACALLGMCLSRCGEQSFRSPENFGLIRGIKPEKVILIFLGTLMTGASILAWTKPDDEFRRIEGELGKGRFDAALEKSQTAIREWPFYWRAHALAGYSAAGLSGKRREVASHYRNAQRLAPVNAEISRQAGLLFLKRSPEMAVDFFKEALARSDRSRCDFMLRNLLEIVFQNKGDVFGLDSLALENSGRWHAMWRFLRDHHFSESDEEEWLGEGMERWLDDPKQRVQLFGPMIESGHAKGVLESFERRAPSTQIEYYWQARALEGIGGFEAAIRKYVGLWRTDKRYDFASSSEVDERALRLAALNPDDLRLQRQVAESLAAQSRHAEALMFWDRVLQDHPGDRLAKYGRALALREVKDWKNAAPAWRHLIEEEEGLPLSL